MIKTAIVSLLLAGQIILTSQSLGQTTTAPTEHKSLLSGNKFDSVQDNRNAEKSIRQVFCKTFPEQQGQHGTWKVCGGHKSEFLPHKISSREFTVNEDVFTGMMRPCISKCRPMPNPKTMTGYYPDKYTNYSRIWLVPLKENDGKVKNLVDIKKWLMPETALPHRKERRMIYMGKDDLYAWYAYMPAREYLELSKNLNLSGGDDKIQIAIYLTSIFNEWSGDYSLLNEFLYFKGAELLPYLDEMVADYFPMRGKIIKNLKSKDPQIIAWLLMQARSSKDTVTKYAASDNLFSAECRPEMQQYKKTLTAALDAEPNEFLETLKKLKIPGTVEYCELVSNNPQNWDEYKLAFYYLRHREGRAISPKIKNAEQILMHNLDNCGYDSKLPRLKRCSREVNEAIDTVIASPDKQEAFICGVNLLYYTFGKEDDKRILTRHLIGKDILSELCLNDPEFSKTLVVLYNNDRYAHTELFAELLGIKSSKNKLESK